MKVYWKVGPGEPREGDVKVLKDGQVLVRQQEIIEHLGERCYHVHGNRNRPVYEWVTAGTQRWGFRVSATALEELGADRLPPPPRPELPRRR